MPANTFSRAWPAPTINANGYVLHEKSLQRELQAFFMLIGYC